MELLILCALIGCIPAAIASSKGRSFFGWWLYGALFFIIALIHSLCIRKDHKLIEIDQMSEGLVKCPYCAEMIKPEAIKCKHCGSDINLAT
ncbi:zinc ribbon domain-containing protein [Pantoea agglomerans]|uniref:zinc ribbon domain-containing protein n=1 Tax=Enterobacter agglomerans TaxID=549 RepID=UPI003209EE07